MTEDLDFNQKEIGDRIRNYDINIDELSDDEINTYWKTLVEDSDDGAVDEMCQNILDGITDKTIAEILLEDYDY